MRFSAFNRPIFPRPAVPLLAAVAALAPVRPQLRAADYYVAPGGNDGNPGASAALPFRTLARATQALNPGDTCWLRSGVYREGLVLERSGAEGRPITFAAYPRETPVIDGSDVVDGPWTRSSGGIWEADATGPVEAVFCDGEMMEEARWPACSLSENWLPDRKWALTDKGSALGRIQSAAVAASGRDFSGGLVYIKLSKGNGCFTRRVLAHRAGSPTVEWDASGLPSEDRLWSEDGLPERIAAYGFAGNRFFIVAPGALGAPGQWTYDAARRKLRFIPPDSGDPSAHVVSIKRRISAFSGESLSDLTFRGIEFRGCNVRFAASRRITLESCRFLYPATLREFPDAPAFARDYKPLWLQGSGNSVERCEIAWSLDAGLVLEGFGNRVEDCVVHDVNLDGRHPGPAISIFGVPPSSEGPGPMPANVVRRCTVYNVGGVGIYLRGHGPAFADHNNVFDGGLYCVDVAALYIPTGEQMAGAVVDHNWLHDFNGIGFRVDLIGRGITFHHNLVWNTRSGCKLEGTVLSAFNNTVLDDRPDSPFPVIVVFDREASPADLAAWRIRNNVAYGFLDRISLRETEAEAGRPRIRPLQERPGAIGHNVTVPHGKEADAFLDPAAFDFRPRPGGPLDRSGVPVPGITPAGDPSPSIGALDSGVPWAAGADWLNGGLAVPASARAATELARSVQPAS